MCVTRRHRVGTHHDIAHCSNMIINIKTEVKQKKNTIQRQPFDFIYTIQFIPFCLWIKSRGDNVFGLCVAFVWWYGFFGSQVESSFDDMCGWASNIDGSLRIPYSSQNRQAATQIQFNSSPELPVQCAATSAVWVDECNITQTSYKRWSALFVCHDLSRHPFTCITLSDHYTHLLLFELIYE